jgi:hypothetical protein
MGKCPIHNLDWRVVPAGVSRATGKPYQAFKACPERGCQERPPREAAAPTAAPAGPSPVRLGLATGMLKSTKPMDYDMLSELEEWVKTGKKPGSMSGGVDGVSIDNIPF